MKVPLAALALFFISSAAFADLTKIGPGIYTDEKNVIVDGNVRYVWNIANLIVPCDREKNLSPRSLRTLYKYDCAKKTAMLLFLFGHEEEMGQGKIVSQVKEPAVFRPEPGIGLYDWMTHACKIHS